MLKPAGIFCALSMSLFPAAAPAADAWAVPTFESLGLYYSRAAGRGACRVRYRTAGAAEWREGYPLVYDQRERQYRGSLVGLTPNTLYDIRIEAGGERVEFQARTRSQEFPTGKTTHLAGGEGSDAAHTRRRRREGMALSDSGAGDEVRERRIQPFRLQRRGGGRLCHPARSGAEERGHPRRAHSPRGATRGGGRLPHHWMGRIGGARVWGVTTGMDSGVYARRMPATW